MMALTRTLVLGAAAGLAAADVPHMNANVKYLVGNPPPSAVGKAMGFRGKSFTVDSPSFKSKYSQVVWHGLAGVPLPADVVQEFDGKVMTVVGWEVDVLRHTSNGTVESVPCYESYNHHYGASLSGKGADVEIVEPSADEPIQHSHGGPRHVFTANGKGKGLAPSAQNFAEHNGNEARQTYHALAEGYGVPIESPTTFHFTPMQINTRNPDGSGTRCNGNCPLPRHQNAWPNASWSGILECPCGSRMLKTFDHRLFSGPTGCTWNSTVTEAAECFAAAAHERGLGLKLTQNRTVSDAAKPRGCYAEGAAAVYNTAHSEAPCTGARCICRAKTGAINGKRFDAGCDASVDARSGEPKSDLLRTHNPTCDLNLYDGGLSCCGGTDPGSAERFLLDADQPIPPLEDEVWFRWRFYYEPQVAQKPTHHLEWQFGRIEYSVRKAPAGTAPGKAIDTLTTRFAMADWNNAQCSGTPECKRNWNEGRPIELLMMGFHCHSPACLGGRLTNADTGEVLCEVKPVAGNSAAAHFEEDYLWLPPCQWGSLAEGLKAPPVLGPDTNFTSVKWTNSSVAHSGVMAIWQGRGALA